MTAKRFWLVVALSGILFFVGGLIGTIVLAAETGEKVPDSQCNSGLRRPATTYAVCYVSDDPKMLLGIGPLLLGGAMAGIGFWRYASSPSDEPAGEVGVAGSGDVAASDNPLKRILDMRNQSKNRRSSRGAPPPGGS